MNDIALLAATFIVFLFGPIAGAYMVVADVLKSRAEARERVEDTELAALGQGVSEGMSSLRDSTLASFHAWLSDYLEQYIVGARTAPAQVTARLFIEAGAGGLGEDSRRMLRRDVDFRQNVFMQITRVTNSLQTGPREAILRQVGGLLALFVCETNPQEAQPAQQTMDPALLLQVALHKCSQLLPTDSLGAEDVLIDALSAMASEIRAAECGIPTLILKWAHIRYRSARMVSHQTSVPLAKVLGNIAKDLNRVASACKDNDMKTVANIVFSGI